MIQFKKPRCSAKAPFILTIVSLSCCVFAMIGSYAKAANALEVPSITAERVTRDTRSGDVLSLDWIQLSPEGLRARQAGASNKFEYLQNFNQGKLWMLDWSRKILLELEPEEVNLDQLDSQTLPESYIATIGEEPQSSILAIEPCIDLVATKIGLAKWREQPVTVWHCEYAGGEHFSKVFYSELWDLVVREERVDQTTIELNNIKLTEFSDSHFIPPNYFRKTDFRELIIGSPEIGSYSE